MNSSFGLLLQFVLKIWGAFILFRKLRPNIVLGTPILISLIGRLLPYKSIIVNEDDFDIIKTKIFSSKGEARRMIQGGGVSINKLKIQKPDEMAEIKMLQDKYILVQKGKKNYYLIEVK